MAEHTKQPKVLGKKSISLKSASGEVLLLKAHADKRTGQFASFMRHGTAKNGNGKREHTRGATQAHPTLADAIKALDALADSAVKLGWQRPVAPVLGRKPDAFDAAHIPAPKPVAKK